ncbi:hypothetical protein GQR58_029576 [Nymphon striatum]|nr:hypothetical protein GQR58_029576 [Nymphon striatum]
MAHSEQNGEEDADLKNIYLNKQCHPLPCSSLETVYEEPKACRFTGKVAITTSKKFKRKINFDDTLTVSAQKLRKRQKKVLKMHKFTKITKNVPISKMQNGSDLETCVIKPELKNLESDDLVKFDDIELDKNIRKSRLAKECAKIAISKSCQINYLPVPANRRRKSIHFSKKKKCISDSDNCDMVLNEEDSACV